jgi:hypothetical protein
MKDVVQGVIQANKDHQYALKVYTERLEAELATVDKLLVCFLFSTRCKCKSLTMLRTLAKSPKKTASQSWMLVDLSTSQVQQKPLVFYPWTT